MKQGLSKSITNRPVTNMSIKISSACSCADYVDQNTQPLKCKSCFINVSTANFFVITQFMFHCLDSTYFTVHLGFEYVFVAIGVVISGSFRIKLDGEKVEIAS